MKKTICIIILVMMITTGTSLNSSILATTSAGDIISGADGFISKGEKDAADIIDDTELKNLSDTIYTILVVVGVVIAIIVGAVLGLKFITEGVDGKAEVQKALMAYVVGCVVIFGAFIIWRIVVNVLRGI